MRHGDEIPREDHGAGFVLDEICEVVVAQCVSVGPLTLTSIHEGLVSDGSAVGDCDALAKFYGVDPVPWAQIAVAGYPVLSGTIVVDDMCALYEPGDPEYNPICLPAPEERYHPYIPAAHNPHHVIHHQAQAAGLTGIAPVRRRMTGYPQLPPFMMLIM